MTRSSLLSGTALIGIMTLALFPRQAMAACTTNTPANSATVTCSGADTTGVSGGADNVSLTVNASSSIITTGTNAINLGFNSTITNNASSTISSNQTAINITGGIVYANGTITGGNGTAINFGNSNANFNLYSASNITGNVIAGSTADLFQLRNGGGTLNVNDIGTKYIGFDQFTKAGAGTWILTGTGNQAWAVQGGTLQGNATSMSGNLAVSSGANVTFDQATDSSYSSVISGAGSLTKTGTGVLVLSGANTYTGDTTISAGTINVSADNNLGTGALTLNGGALQSGAAYTNTHAISVGASGGMVDTNSFATTLSGVISGSGTITKNGAGTLTLNSTTNTNTGNWIISAGSLTGTTSSIKGDINNSGGLRFAQAIDGIYSGIISGSGSLSKGLSGTVTLTGASTYTGGTTIQAGILNVSANNNLGAASSALTLDGGTLQSGAAYTNTHAIALTSNNGMIDTNGFATTASGVISGAGSLTKTGAGTLILTGNNTYSGGTTVFGGALQVSVDNNLGTGALTLDGGTLSAGAISTSIAKNIALGAGGGTINNASGGGATFSGIISGTGSLTHTGGNTRTLSGANTYTGGTILSGGNLIVNADNNLGGTSGNLTFASGNTATFTYGTGFLSTRNVILSGTGNINTNGNNSTLSGIISGSNGLVKIGTGTLTLSGANTYTGGTTISSGTINVGSNSNLGSGALTLNGGTLQSGAVYTNTQAISLGSSNGTIDTNGFSNTFSGVISGSGSLTKTSNGTLTLTGTNTYTGGTIISGTNASALNVSSDSNLGAASGTLTLNGGQLQYGASFNSARNITLIGSTNSINTQSNNSTLSGIISGSGGFGKNGTGTLTLTGTNTFTGEVGIYNGILNVNADANLGTGAKNIYMDNGTLQFASGFTTSKQIAIGSNAGTIDTNGNNATLSGLIRNTGSSTGQLVKTGAGTLIITGTNTYVGGTTITGGTLNVSADNNLGTGGITLNGGTLQSGAAYTNTHTISLGASGGTIDTNGYSTTASGVISGTGSLTKTGSGTLTLSGTNTYSGGTTLSNGTIEVSSSSALGTGQLTISNNAILLGNTSDIHNTIFLSNTGGTIRNASGSLVSLQGVISGSGTLTKTGSNSIRLTQNNTYTGETIVYGGSLWINSANSLGAESGNLTLDNGGIRYEAGFSSSRNTILGSGGGTINTNGFDSTISGSISGAGALTKTGAGTLTLSGTNIYTGGTTISGGVLRGSTTSLQGNIVNNGTLNFSQTTNGSYSSLISGTGNLIKDNIGTLTLSGANTYSGGTTVSAGTLEGTTTSLQGAILNNAAVTFDQSGNGTYAGIMSGTGSFNKTGSGTVILSGANTYSGGTTITGGALVGTTSSLQGNVVNDSVVAFDQNTNGTYAGNISGTGGLIKAGSGNVTLSGTNTYTGGTVVSAGTLTGTAANIQGDVDNNAIVVFNQTLDDIYAGVMSGLGSLTKTGAGILTLTGFNNYSGGTIVSAGELVGDTNSLQGDVTNNAALSFNQAFNGNYAGIISGTGSLTKTGIGNLILSGTNTYTGGTTVSDGRLSVNGSITGTTTVASSGTLGGNGNFGAIVANGRIAPGNSIGIMNVTGPVTFNSGSIYEVEVDASGNSDKLITTGALTINSGATVDVRAASGMYADNTVYNDILQGSSRTGTFAGITTNLAFLTPTLSYDATSVDLTIARNDVEFAVVAKDEVQAGVANAVQALGSGNDLYTAFSGLTINEASAALDTLSGEHNAGITTATAQSASVIQNVISSRVQNLGAQNIQNLEPAAGDSSVEIKKSFWSEIFGSRGHSDEQGSAPAQNRESSGALFGGDAELSNDIFIGAFGGYEIGEVYTDTQNANSDVNSYHAGVYASKNITPSWRISGILIGSYHDIGTTRHIQFTGFSETPEGNTSGYTVTPAIEAGYKFGIRDVAVEPFLGISLTHSYIGSYSEKDGGSANLDVDNASQTNMTHTLGFRLSKSLSVTDETSVNLTARFGWNHIYGDLDTTQTMQFSGGTTPFDVKGAGLARNSAVFGAGADIALGIHDATAYVNYVGEASKDTDNHGVTLGVKVPF